MYRRKIDVKGKIKAALYLVGFLTLYVVGVYVYGWLDTLTFR